MRHGIDKRTDEMKECELKCTYISDETCLSKVLGIEAKTKYKDIENCYRFVC